MQPAQIDKMLMAGRPFGKLHAGPFADELLCGHLQALPEYFTP